jgi:hypothetical protein
VPPDPVGEFTQRDGVTDLLDRQHMRIHPRDRGGQRLKLGVIFRICLRGELARRFEQVLQVLGSDPHNHRIHPPSTIR